MRLARLVICLLAISGGAGAALALLPRAVRSLHSLTVPTLTLPTTTTPVSRPAHPPPDGRHVPRRPRFQRDANLLRMHPAESVSARDAGSLSLLIVIGLEVAAGLLLIAAVAAALIVSRARHRRTRPYALYELHLSTHDQAKGQDLEDLVESIANIVRVWPAERARRGQPYLALELICSTVEQTAGGPEMEWSINIRCEPTAVVALDGAISAAYPDIRLGRVHGEQPRPRPGRLREPGYVMRFRKERSFVYSLIADGEEQASAPLEQIARAQIAVAAPTVVRFQLTPTPVRFEALARRLYRRRERKLVRQERWGLPEGGLTSTFNRAEMRAAERTQNRSLFWLETVVAADTPEACKTVAAAVQSRRGENRLHRCCMTVRRGLYRRRFPCALGPLVPSFRSLVSAAEVAHLLELPSARMKGVPVRRMTIPRIPAPPEIVRGSRLRRPSPMRAERSTPGTDGRGADRHAAVGATARTT